MINMQKQEEARHSSLGPLDGFPPGHQPALPHPECEVEELQCSGELRPPAECLPSDLSQGQRFAGQVGNQ